MVEREGGDPSPWVAPHFLELKGLLLKLRYVERLRLEVRILPKYLFGEIKIVFGFPVTLQPPQVDYSGLESSENGWTQWLSALLLHDDVIKLLDRFEGLSSFA